MVLACSACLPATAPTSESAAYGDSGFHIGERGLNPSERAGREIWYKATGGNERFHTYVLQQRLGILIDWFKVLTSESRAARFKVWGLISDPDCCQPAADGCPAQSLDETFGFDWCPGDETLLQFVGREGYRDPACSFRDAPVFVDDLHGPDDKREDACHLRFGTSTGVLGLRKFPNPRFDENKWLELTGGVRATWEGYGKRLSAYPDRPDHDASHLSDSSIEPPFLIGIACGACHVAFDPLRPPADPTQPVWENINGLVGNQYVRMSRIFTSGMPESSLEWQVFSHPRPGTVDTSAIPNDLVSNAGTINALSNIKQRPVFEDEVIRWRKVSACQRDEQAEGCWCEPGKSGKCWRKGLETETVPHILKGGADSIGIEQALQRVYNNIGSCAEQCWINHLTDLRELDSRQRGFGQTPMDMGQCRRDCASFRALEDRLGNIRDFVLSSKANATDLDVARENMLRVHDPQARYEHDDLVDDLEDEFGQGAVQRGKLVFADRCARCHSSLDEMQHGPFRDRDYRAVSEESGLRADWLGNDRSTLASEVGTYRCRALHSNHMSGHIWQEFGSETYRSKPPDANVKEPSDGGRGYYRNTSLLNLWAHAPFMHNNALGPELCGRPADEALDYYRSSYVDDRGQRLPEGQQPPCWEYDPSVEGRYRLYKASMALLLHPDERIPKITKTDESIEVMIGPRLWDGEGAGEVFGFALQIQEGRDVGLLGNFQHKRFINDLVQAKINPTRLEQRLRERLGSSEARALADELGELADEIVTDPARMLSAVEKRPHLLESVYSSCTAAIENAGHRFGEDLSDRDKLALTAFLATL